MKRRSDAPFPSWPRGVAAALVMAAVALLAGPAPRRHVSADGGQPARIEDATAARELSPAAGGAGSVSAAGSAAPTRPLMHVKGPMMIVRVSLPRAAHAR